MSTTIQGLDGSFEIIHWHVGDGVRITIHYSNRHSTYIVTNQEKVKHLWIPALTIYDDDATIVESVRLRVSLKGGNYYIEPPFSTYYTGCVAIFTPIQMREIVKNLRPPEVSKVEDGRGLLQTLKDIFITN